MCFGVAPSGLPMPKSMMSSPRARAAAFISLVMLKTYGGRRFSLKNSCIGLVPMVLLDTLIPIALNFQRVANRSDMRCATRFECDVYNCIAQIDAVISTIVYRLDNVCPLVGEDFRQLMQSSRPIGKMDANAYSSAVLDQTAFDNPGQQAYIDIAAADQDRSALAFERGLFLQQS